MKRWLSITSFWGWVVWQTAAAVSWAGPVAAPKAPPALSEKQWQSVFGHLEKEVWDLYQWMDKTQSELKALRVEIQDLESNVESLRKQERGQPGVFQEVRLKVLLNDLKPKLEKHSLLQRQWNEKQRDFQQKVLSLLSLYNDKIESELGMSDSTLPPDEKIRHLEFLSQKRSKLQKLLGAFGGSTQPDQKPAFSDYRNFASTDREGLQLALHLLEDRNRELEEQLEKLSLEEGEIKNELRLQVKMQDFLDGIHRMNEDSNLAHDSLKQEDLDSLTNKSQKRKFESRLGEIQNIRERDQKIILQIKGYVEKISKQMEKSRNGKGGDS